MNPNSGHLSQLRPELQDRVNTELQDGEEIVWLGQPLTGHYIVRYLPAVLVGISFVGMSFLFDSHGRQIHTGPEGIAVEIRDYPGLAIRYLFFVVGIAACLSPIWFYWQSKRIAYVLTTRRALVIEGGLVQRFRSYEPSQLRDLTRKENADGIGDLIFQREKFLFGISPDQTSDRGFLAIANVRDVEYMLRDLIRIHHNQKRK